ncbi:AGAP007888-PA [Anopheles gambiae str. PEST]|uniref:AGAP007888-PA n=1 Tax=Anopheles gambiae TaxID=7165 RepID=Q7PN51_ANOGA|nr:AGAP007888-PA [Anopheles gambiae str. PEST]
MALSSDPYEQKLYHMFQAHSSPGNGVLDRDALVKLCHTLELKERGHLLVKCLMTGSKTHVSFREFREGLLHILGGNDGSSSQQPAGTGDLDAAATSPQPIVNRLPKHEAEVDETSDREVSPKFVVGTKKYGRRSRPREDVNGLDSSSLSSNSDNESVTVKSAARKTAAAAAAAAEEEEPISVQRSASQSDIHGSKRRRPVMAGGTGVNRLKRCASLPTHRQRPTVVESKRNTTTSIEEMSFLISFFFCLMHLSVSDWTSEIGSLAASIIIDMWESAGIDAPANLLHDLGFDRDVIQVADLVQALEEEHQRLVSGHMNSSTISNISSNPFDDAALIVRAFHQLVEENKKLYADNKEVNHRAVLLAQEVDERHNSLENSTRTKIRHLEQRHHETVKELSSQLAFEREQLSHANAMLEKRIQALEGEEGKLKTEISRLAEENDELRQDQENLTKEITDLLEKNIKLNRDIAELEENNRNDYADDDECGFVRKDSEEVLDLIDRISLLQSENTGLRDKNDELSAEIETLNVELSKFKLKRCTTAAEDLSAAGSGDGPASSAAIKRRGDSPSKTRLADESHRLGKFRRCSNENDIESDSSSGDWMALHSELGQSLRGAEVAVTSSEVAAPTPAENSTPTKEEECKKLKARCEELESSLEQMRKEYEDCEDYWQTKVNDERLLYEEEQRMSDEKFTELLKKVAEYEEQFAGNSKMEKDGRLSPIDEKDGLEQQYLELEADFEQAQLALEERTSEVEKLRRRIQEMEQMHKYPSEMLLKIIRALINFYISPFNSSPSPRVETPDVEDRPASSPISYLWNQSTIQRPVRDYQNPNWRPPTVANAISESVLTEEKCSIAVATPLNAEGVTENKSSEFMGSSTEVVDVAAASSSFDRIISPIQKPTTVVGSFDGESSSGAKEDESQHCTTVAVSIFLFKSFILFTCSQHSIANSEGSTSGVQTKHLRLMQLQLQDEIKDLTHERDCLMMELQQLKEAKSVLARSYAKTASHPNQMQKIQNLEQKNRHLQLMVKQQQQYTESILHQIWQQQRSEINDLRNRLEAQCVVISDQAARLANNDILVKDMYAENSQLMLQVQRLEHQCNRANWMQQYNQSNSSSGSHHGLSGIMPGLP